MLSLIPHGIWEDVLDRVLFFHFLVNIPQQPTQGCPSEVEELLWNNQGSVHLILLLRILFVDQLLAHRNASSSFHEHFTISWVLR